MQRSSQRLASTAAQLANNNGLPSPYSWISNAEAGPSRPTGRLHGKRIAIKENISYSKAPTTCSSRILADFHPPYNATCVNLLLRDGASIHGMTKMDEFGMGSSSTHIPHEYTPVYNPYQSAKEPGYRIAGGSSGGSAVAVAEGSCWAALGTDTGGSVRLPAAYCGVVGFKPSYGMISRHGVIAYADSLDCVGILSRDIAAAESMFETTSQPDENDMTCLTAQHRHEIAKQRHSHISKYFPSYPKSDSLRGLRIGLPIQTHFSPPSIQLPTQLLMYLRGIGAELKAVSLPNLKLALPAYYVLASAEASSNLARYGGGFFGSTWEREFSSEDVSGFEDQEGSRKMRGEERRKWIRSNGFGQEVKKRILAGTCALSADEFDNTYLKALHLRELMKEDYNSLFRIPHPLLPPNNFSTTAPTGNSSSRTPVSSEQGVDILLHPTAIQPAPLIDSLKGRSTNQNEYIQDLLTVPASLAGLPAINVPTGKQDGLPVGMTLTGQYGMEEIVFWVAKAIESWTKEQ